MWAAAALLRADVLWLGSKVRAFSLADLHAVPRSAKLRLTERFDANAGPGTATARHGHHENPFGCLSNASGADDLFGSPSTWAAGHQGW